MKYWFNALLGIALASAAVAVVSWCTWAWTRTSLCGPADEQLACRLEGEQFIFPIAIALFVAIPIASAIFMRRTNPHGTSLGFLALGLAVTAAGGAALYSALGGDTGTSADVAGYIVAGVTLSIGPFMLLGGIATTGTSAALQAQRTAVLEAHGGDASAAVAAIRAARSVTVPSGGGHGGGGASAAAAGSAAQATSQLAGLAAQLSQMAAARERTSGDKIASALRQLDDLRASGLLTPEEHERKRREILDTL